MSRLKLFYIFLILMCFLNGGKWLLNFIQTPYEPIDFRGCYLSSLAYWQGLDPYQYQDQSRLWVPLQAENHDWPMVENRVYATPLYPPQFVLFFGLYNLLAFKQALVLQFALNLLALWVMVWAVNQLNPFISKKLAALFIFSFRGTWYALDTGQPMLQVFAVALLAFIYLLKHPDNPYIGLVLGFISFKFTLLIPFVFYFVVKRQFKVLAGLISSVILLNAAVLLFDLQAVEHLRSWQAAMQLMNDYLHKAEAYNGLSIIATSISIPFSKLIGLGESISSAPLIFTARVLIPILPYLLIWWYRKRLNGFSILLMASLTGLCFGHHLVYDVLTFIIYSLLVYQKGKTLLAIECALLLTLTLPMGMLAALLKFPMLHYLTAVSLFMYFIFKMYQMIKPRKTVVQAEP